MALRQDRVRGVIVALYTLFEHLQRAGRRGSGATLGLLRLIGDRDGIRPSDAALELGIHASTITRQLQTLVAAGFVTEHPNPHDKRSNSLSLSPEGRAEIARLANVGFARFDAFLERWSDEDIRTLERLLTKFQTTLANARSRDTSEESPPSTS